MREGCVTVHKVRSAVSPLSAYFRSELAAPEDAPLSALMWWRGLAVAPQLCVGCTGYSSSCTHHLMWPSPFCVQDPLLLVGLQCSELRTTRCQISQTGTNLVLSVLSLRL